MTKSLVAVREGNNPIHDKGKRNIVDSTEEE